MNEAKVKAVTDTDVSSEAVRSADHSAPNAVLATIFFMIRPASVEEKSL